MPTKKSTRKVAKRSTVKKSTTKKSTAKKSAAKRSTAKKSTAKKSTSKKKSPVAKMIERPQRTVRKAVKVARATAARTHDVGEAVVGAADLVKKTAEAVDKLVTGKRRRN